MAKKKGQDFIWCLERTEEKEFDLKKKEKKKAYTHTHTQTLQSKRARDDGGRVRSPCRSVITNPSTQSSLTSCLCAADA